MRADLQRAKRERESGAVSWSRHRARSPAALAGGLTPADISCVGFHRSKGRPHLAADRLIIGVLGLVGGDWSFSWRAALGRQAGITAREAPVAAASAPPVTAASDLPKRHQRSAVPPSVSAAPPAPVPVPGDVRNAAPRRCENSRESSRLPRQRLVRQLRR